MKHFLFSLLILVVISTNSQTLIPNIDWVKYYGNATTPSLSAIESAIDANSNVYVVGNVQGATKDMVILKYDSLGAFKWSYVYNNGNDDMGIAICVDASGNVYATGKSYGTGTTNYDVVTIKLNSSGVNQWTKRYNQNNGVDEPCAIKVDGSGGVYVAGTFYNGSIKKNDIGVVKWTATGSQTWAVTFDGASDNDQANALVLSSNSNSVYVAGNKGVGSGTTDIVVRALKASSGGTNWTYTVNGTASDNDEANALILAGANVVLCGKVTNTTTGVDYTTIKLNGSTGAQIFRSDYDNGNNPNYATSLCRDSTGNMATVGRYNNGSTYEYRTVFYDSTGTQLWVNVENTLTGSSTLAPRIVCDTLAHHLYVSGEVMNSTNDVMAYQISPTGTTKWKRIYDRGYGYDAALSIAVNGVGVVYLGAISTNSAFGYDITTIKLNQTPIYAPYDLNGDTADLGFQYYENKGQLLDYSVAAVPQIEYYTPSKNPKVFIEPLKNHFVYSRGDQDDATNDSVVRVDLTFVNANSYSEMYTNEETQGYVNYYLSHLDSGITGLTGHKRLFVPNIWSYVDMHYYSNRDCIKYYLVLKQNTGNLKDIRFNFTGQNTSTITNHQIINDCYLGTLTFARPKIYQVDTSLNIISTGTGRWVKTGSDYTIDSLTNVVSMWPIVIQLDVNPSGTVASTSTTGLNWSTLFQNGTMDEIRVSNLTGRQYITGSTSDPNYPNVNGLQTYATANFADAFFTQFNTNNSIKWSTIFGGSATTFSRSADFGTGIDYDSQGNVYVGGYTYADSIPTKQSTKAGSYFQKKMTYPATGTNPNYPDAFLLKVDSLGGFTPTGLKWCTMLGGKLDETINDIRYQNGFIYCVGNGGKKDFANPAYSTPYQFKSGAYWQDTAYGYCSIYKFSDSLIYNWGTGFNRNPTTFTSSGSFGINACDVYSISIGAKGTSAVSTSTYGLVITGWNDCSGSLPRTLAGANLPGGNTPTSVGDDAFITMFDENDALKYSTYIGSSGQDRGLDITTYNTKAYIVGYTSGNIVSPNKFPVKYGVGEYIDSVASSGSDGFLCEFDVNDGLYKYGTYIGGVGSDEVDGVCTDQNGAVYIHGTTSNNNLYTPPSPPAGLYSQSASTSDDAFVGCFSGRVYKWNTYFGGTWFSDAAKAISAYKTNDIYVVGAGMYMSGTFPTNPGVTGGYYTTTGNMYVSRLGISALYVGIRELSTDKLVNNILVYPNPSYDRINVELQERGKNCKLDIYNSIGQLVYSSKIEQDRTGIDIENFKPGVYIIKITDKEKAYAGKFIKE